MQDYMSYNIEHHPSVASEYAKFLVLNHGSGSDKNEGESDGETDTKFSSMQARVVAVEKLVKSTQDKQATTANSLAQLKEKVTALE